VGEDFFRKKEFGPGEKREVSKRGKERKKVRGGPRGQSYPKFGGEKKEARHSNNHYSKGRNGRA